VSAGLVPGRGGEIVRRSRGAAARGLELAEHIDDGARPVLPPSPGAFRSVALSADGRLLAAARSGYSVSRGLLVAALDGSGATYEDLGEEWVRAVRFLGAGEDLVAVTHAGDIVQLGLDRGRLRELVRRRCPAGPGGPPRALCVAPDGGFVAVLRGRRTLAGLPWPDGRGWTFDLDRETGGSPGRLDCAFEPAPDGKLAVAGRRVLVFDRSGSGGRLSALDGALARGPSALRWTGNDLLAVDGPDLVRCPLLGGRPAARPLAASVAEAGRAAISPAGSLVALDLGPSSGVVEVYDPAGRRLARRPADARGAEALALADDGRLAVAGAGGSLTAWPADARGEPLLAIGDRAGAALAAATVS